MITINLKDAAFQRAITRAKSESLHVKALEFGCYKVVNHSHDTEYVVRFWKQGTDKIGACSCKAGQSSMLCKHVAASIGLHVHLASNRS
jgi:hypothetical protein